MRKSHICLLLCAVPAVMLLVREDKAHDDKGHLVVMPDKIKWGPAPPGLPAGAQVAVLDGNPKKEGSPYTMRVKLPDGFKVPPHWHPVDENVTVLKGCMLMGRGEKFDADRADELTVGAFSHMPKGMRHFAMAKGETIIQVNGVGPFEINYVNPDDDPRKKKD
jgi:quercetin dioxygenase-like cupin family protein